MAAAAASVFPGPPATVIMFCNSSYLSFNSPSNIKLEAALNSVLEERDRIVKRLT